MVTLENFSNGIIIGLIVVIGTGVFLSQLNINHGLPANAQIGLANTTNLTVNLVTDAKESFDGISQGGGSGLNIFSEFIGLGAFILLFPIRLINIAFSAISEALALPAISILQINPLLVFIFGLITIAILFAGIRGIRGGE